MVEKRSLFLKKLTRLKLFVLFCFVSFYFVSFIALIQSFDDLNPTVIVKRKNFKDNQSVVLYKGEGIIGGFRSKYPNLGTISVKFNTYNRINTDFLQFRIKEKGSNEWFYTAKYKVDQFQNNRYFPFGFPEVADSKNKEYEFEITSLDGYEGNLVSINFGSNQFLVKNNFSKNFLIQNKTYIPFFILNKIGSYFSYVDSSVYFLFLFQLVVIFSLFTLIKYIYLNFTKFLFLKDTLNKKYLFRIIFLVFSFVIFMFLISRPQVMVYDAADYFGMGGEIYNNNFNVFKVDLVNRTYVYPFIISLLYWVSNFISAPVKIVVFSFNYLLFIFSIFLIASVIEKYNKKISNIFLLLSAFNVLNLSFVNTVLTESIGVFFVCSLFYLFNSNFENKKLSLFFIGLISALSVLTRPSNLLIFLITFIFILYLTRKKILNILFFLLPIFLIFFVSMSYSRKIDGKYGLFTKATNGIYNMQMIGGINYFKYETTVDKKYSSPSIYYGNRLYTGKLNNSENCFYPIECASNFITKDPVNYLTVLAIHSFSLFDRNYIETYISKVDKVDGFLIAYNYLILSSFVCGFVFFINTKIFKKYKKLILTSLVLIIGTLLIYVPAIVEPRFSAPVYPLFVAFASFYIYKLLNTKNKEKIIKIVLLQLFVILLFVMMSYLIRQTAYLQLRG